jgi:hypothetical protein
MEDTTIERRTDSLKKASTALVQLNSSTENDFLSTGAHLQSLSDQTREITSMATQATGMIRSREMERNTSAGEHLGDNVELF